MAAATRVVAASLFTTQSITADLHKIMRQIKRTDAGAGELHDRQRRRRGARGVPAGRRSPASSSTRQTGTAPSFAAPSFLPTPALGVVPGAVGQIAYGQLPLARLPDARASTSRRPRTLTGQPQVQGSNELVVQLFLPAGAKPAGGWPVAIFGHGFTDSMYGAPWTRGVGAAPRRASPRCRSTSSATAAAPLGTLTVLRPAAARR